MKHLLFLLLPIAAFAQNPSPCLNIVNTAGTGQVLSAVNGGTTTPPCRWIAAGGGGTGTVTSIATSNGITGGPITTTGTISGINAGADGATKGVAAFAALDFNATTGVISIDYTNGQKATAGQPGFLTAADWTTFNNKGSGNGNVTAAGTLTSNQIVLGAGTTAVATLGSLGTTTTLLHGNAAGAPTFAAVVSADLNITTTTCTNQFLTAISATGTGTCTTVTLAGAQFANQGTTTTVLHGNAAGNPSFTQIVNADITNSTIDLTAKVTGVLPTANIAVALANQTSLRGNSMAAAAGDATIGQVIAHGAKALDFASTATGACATVITDTATGAASTDTIIFTTNASIKAVTGYVPAATGGFSINAFPSSNLVSFEGCNWTSGTVDPGSITVNWVVIR